MYKEFFGLRANPFNVNPDPRYLFLTRHTEEALACLTYGIQSRKGFVLLRGEVGTGKTTLINKLLEWLRLQQVATAFIFNSRMNVPQFLDYMMADFGIPCDSRAKCRNTTTTVATFTYPRAADLVSTCAVPRRSRSCTSAFR